MRNTLHPPPEIIATFPKPNYVNPETHGPGLMVAACLLSAIGVIVVGARLYARFYITKAPGIDDLLIILALIFGVTLSILVMLGNQIYYNGYHSWDIPLSSYVPHRINVWVAQLCYTLALSSVKISVLLFYRRLSVSFNRSFIIAVWIGIVYNVLYCLAFVLALCLLYRPLQAYWLTFDPVYYVKGDWSSGREEIAVPLSALFSVTGDAYATILPLILVHGLSLPRRQKWALYALFSLGIATIVFGALRTYWIWRLFTKDWDFTWSLWKAWLFGELEIWSAVYAASAPALKPFFKRYFDRRRTHAGSNGGNAVYVVRGDSQGKLGKVEKLWVSSRSRRSTVPSSEEEDVELVGANGTNGLKSDGGRMGISPSHIVKQVEYDVERCVSANAEGVEALPAWERRWPLQRSGSLSVASGPLSRRAS